MTAQQDAVRIAAELQRQMAEAHARANAPREPVDEVVGWRVGWDPASTGDYSVIAVTQVWRTKNALRYRIRHLTRDRGTDTTIQVANAIELLLTSELNHPRTEVVIDRNGMGVHLVNDLRAKARLGQIGRLRGHNVIGLHTGSGNEPSRKHWTVPKFLLYNNLKITLEERRIEVAESHELAEAWRYEMKDFQARAGALGHVTLSAPAGRHDDFVSASALACWEWPNQPVAIPAGGFVEFGAGRRDSPWGGARSWGTGGGGRFGGTSK